MWHFCVETNNGMLKKSRTSLEKIVPRSYLYTCDDHLGKAGTQIATYMCHKQTRRLDVFCDQRLKTTIEQTIETPVIWDAIAHIMTSLLYGLIGYPLTEWYFFQEMYAIFNVRFKYHIKQPKRRTVTFGLWSFPYANAKLWNDWPN